MSKLPYYLILFSYTLHFAVMMQLVFSASRLASGHTSGALLRGMRPATVVGNFSATVDGNFSATVDGNRVQQLMGIECNS